MIVRGADESEIDVLSRLWYDGWQDAHSQLAPAELKRHRTLQSFRDRLQAALPGVRVAGPLGAPAGFHMIKSDELYQLYVSAASRGTGVAAVLIADAETRLRESGARIGWLSCAIGNERAARFYEKSGWLRVGTMVSQLEIPGGLISLEVWRYEKALDFSS